MIMAGWVVVARSPASKPTFDYEPVAGAESETTLVEKDLILVEVSGAVSKPAVYELPEGSRVVHCLQEAGGLTAAADKVWVEKNINLAAKVEDGDKLYFPYQGEAALSGEGEGGLMTKVSPPTALKVNLNRASLQELDALWGIGPARAQAIVAGRPYQRVEELLERRIVPSNVFKSIRDQVAIE